ncbi:hypothetical protein [Kaistella polysaccharea]|uniref:hypothetical protein n=1 Tax=Kaistella polysaccharea TaxID=2878534 RepID=UPI001CF226D7|nr:hypothetical protein [Kaistella polysaccharea]
MEREKEFDDIFYVLIKDGHEYRTEKMEVRDLLPNYLHKASQLCNIEKDNYKEFYDEIKNELLPVLNKTYSYCSDLGDSFINSEISLNKYINIIQKFLITSRAEKGNEDYSHYKKRVITFLLKHKEKFNYFLNFEELKVDESILILSNRIGGWSNPVYKISDDFSIEVKSNFGYGRASYFYITVKYKNVNITRFSDWIYYRYAKFYEVSRYTKKYHYVGDKNKKLISYKSWVHVTELSRELINLIENDLPQFIKKYIINECNLLINGLHYILKNESFKFDNSHDGQYTDDLPDFKRVDLNGEELIELRTEKVVGALDFISEINALSDLTDVSSFVKEIEKMNVNFFPIAENEFLRLTPIYLEKKKVNDDHWEWYNKFIKDSYIEIEKIEDVMVEFEDEDLINLLKSKIDEIKSKMHIEGQLMMKKHSSTNRLRIKYELFEDYIGKFEKHKF